MRAYNVICPRCGHPFQIQKGETLYEGIKGIKVPKSRNENVPDYCPKCHHRMSVKDPDFRKHVIESMFVD